jgi:ribosomal protein S8
MSLFCNLTSQLKNAIKSNQKFVYFPKTSLSYHFLKVLFFEGFVSGVVEIRSGKILKVILKYNSNATASFKEIKNFSTSNKKFNLSYSQIVKTSTGFVTFVISTNGGIFTNNICLKRKIGGTILCSIF